MAFRRDHTKVPRNASALDRAGPGREALRMDRIILLHGLGRGPVTMWPMGLALRRAGFQTLAIGYPSRRGTIAGLTAGIAQRLPAEGVLGFVGHSLGGVLAKRLMRGLPPERRGRIVQLGSPNAGSALAGRLRVLEPVMGPVMAELEPGAIPDDGDLEIGAIAGTAALAAYGRITGIAGLNDGKVTVRSAWGSAPEGRRIALPVAHATMMLDPRVIKATVRFMQTGRFD